MIHKLIMSFEIIKPKLVKKFKFKGIVYDYLEKEYEVTGFVYVYNIENNVYELEINGIDPDYSIEEKVKAKEITIDIIRKVLDNVCKEWKCKIMKVEEL